MADTFEDVARSKYLLLTTFTKDGRPKPTTVWGVKDGDKLLISTDDGSWKTKRINNTPRVTIQRSSALGKPKGEPVEAVARNLPKSENRRVFDMVTKKYWGTPGGGFRRRSCAAASTRSTAPSRSSRLSVRHAVNLRNRSLHPVRSLFMAMRLFLLYTVIELAVIVALVSTIGFGWTVLLLLGTFVVGIALAGSQVKRHFRRLRSGLNPASVQGAAADSLLVALGTVLVVIPGLASSVVGALLLLPPTRAAARPLVTAMAARRMPLITVAGATGYTGHTGYTAPPGDYIDGEVIDVTDIEPPAVERKPD